MKKKNHVMMYFLLFLVVMLPIVQALEISNVRAEELTPNSAIIRWETDEPANGFVEYGKQNEPLQRIGDAKELMSHEFQLQSLEPDTTYTYKIESDRTVDDNAGNLYSFKTLPPDSNAPVLEVTVSESVAGTRLDLQLKTEIGAVVKISVNNILRRTLTAAEEQFTVQGIVLDANKANIIKIEATDEAGNTAEFTATVASDNNPPKITLQKIPELIAENKIKLQGTVSENSSIEIFVNNRSVAKAQGTTIDQELRLQEGTNHIRVVATDAAGWKIAEQLTLDADTVPPKVDFTLVSGSEYYENRAETDITGTTEPGANVFLYIYQRRVDQFRADFSRPVEVVKANEEGKFTFKEVEFPPSIISLRPGGNASRVTLVPRQVPSGLQDVLISPLDKLKEEQRKSFDVIIIAEDKTGKSGYEKRVVNVNSCSTSNFAFDLVEIIEFHQPFRLNPSVLEEGRETVQAVFNLSYKGNSIGNINPRTNQLESPYVLVGNPRFEKACTQATRDTDSFGAGCQLMQSGSFTVQPNHDKTAFYITANLRATKDFLDRGDDLWEDFKDRNIKIPMKVTVRYRERDHTGGLSETKTQVMCSDLAYFVDIPADIQEFVPDWLANDVVSGLNDTINAIEDIKPYLETAMIATGVGCGASFIVKMATRFYRFFISNFEPWLTKFNPEKKDEGCPIGKAQNELYLDSTIENWKESNAQDTPADYENKKLSESCPQTAKAWELEEFFDQAYRWTCDRFLCREVPARWTEDKEKEQVDEVRQEQLQCTATSNGVPLQKFENCNEHLEKSPDSREILRLKKEEVVQCWRDSEGVLYAVFNDRQDNLNQQNIWRLTPVGNVNIGKVGERKKTELLAYQPEGSDSYIVGTDLKCNQMCSRKKGYNATNEGYKINDAEKASCYKQTEESLIDGKKAEISTPKIPAGYTSDCFIDKANPAEGLYQCVCEPEEGEKKEVVAASARIAGKSATEAAGEAEEWHYRQSRLYAEFNGQFGTLYPKWRYYGGRDFSGAFGLDYGLDNFKSENYAETTVNPNTQWIGSVQTMCLPGINARLTTLQSILKGFQGCITEAKYTGLKDAGLCKTLFTQYACGMIYKGIAYLASSCSPLSFKDIGKNFEDPTDGGVRAFFDAGFKAIPQAIETSINEVQEDYGNAKLDQAFSTGVQGFSESICLAAFGFDFPYDIDFLQDVAYSFPTATNVFFPVANREFSSFDPLLGTAVYNYELGGVILPGCKIRGYQTELKCVGPDDWGKPGVACSDQGCDCLQATGLRPEFAGARTRKVEGGSSFSGLKNGQLLELPIPSPQRVSSQYRYDHVILTLFLDQHEDPKTCFDEQYRTPNGGQFYFPISTVGPDTVAGCQVDTLTGRFKCPDIASLFGGGQTYFEHPFMSCLDSVTGQYVDCQTPNLFIKDQDIVVKPHINLGKEAVCLQISDPRGLIERKDIPIPEQVQGPYSPPINLGRVTENMISGGAVGTIELVAGSDPGCGGHGVNQLHVIERPRDNRAFSEQSFTFRFTKQGDINTFVVDVPRGVDVADVSKDRGYKLNERNELLLNNNNILTRTQIDDAIFTYQSFTFDRVFGNPQPQTGNIAKCTYRTRSPRGGQVANIGSVQITAKLLQAPQAGTCFQAKDLVPKSALGTNVHTQSIRVQAETVEVKDMHTPFMQGRYDRVMEIALPITQRKESDRQHVLAIYYWVASLIMKEKTAWVANSGDNIKGLLALFFDRNYNDKETLEPYPESLKRSPEFEKICKYLCEVDEDLYKDEPSKKHMAQCQQLCPPAP